MNEKLFQKGFSPRQSSGGGGFMAIGAGEEVQFVPLVGLDEIITTHQHSWWDVNPAPHLVCLRDSSCPSCELGHESVQVSYLPVLTKSNEVKLLIAKASMLKQMSKQAPMLPGKTIAGQVYTASRTGKGFQTTYTAVPAGKRVDISKVEIPDWLPLFGALNRNDQIDKMIDSGVPGAGGLEKEAIDISKPSKKQKRDSAPTAKVESEAVETPFDVEEDDAPGWLEL